MYNKIINLLEQAKNYRGAQIGLNTIIMQDNIDHIPDIIKLAENYGTNVTLMPYNPVKNRSAKHNFLSTEPRMRYSITNFKRRFNGMIINPFTTLSATEYFLASGNYGKCEAGHSFLWIRPDGKLVACTDHPESEGSILKEVRSFKSNNRCNNCYVPCRSITETATSRNPFTLFSLAKELYSGIYKKLI